jgi:hypothetical protein
MGGDQTVLLDGALVYVSGVLTVFVLELDFG